MRALTILSLLVGCAILHAQDAVTVTPDGSVGIGTSSPQERLHVAGDVQVDGNLTVSGRHDGVPPGALMTVVMDTPPDGYLKANGALVSRTTYADLFAAIGTKFGEGDGSTTFALPDLRGEFIRGWDDGRGVDAGRAIGTGQAEEVGPHTHPFKTWKFKGEASGISDRISTSYTNQYRGVHGGAILQNNGTETRPRNIALLYVIKY